MATLQSEIVALRSVELIYFNDFGGGGVTTCNRLLSSLPPENTYARSLLLLMLGLAYQRGINIAAAAQALSEARSYSQATRHILIAPYIMISQAELYESLASPFQALKLYQQVLKLTNGRAGHPSGIAAASMGYLFWEWQNLEVARKYLLQAWNIGQEIRNSNVICNSGFLFQGFYRYSVGGFNYIDLDMPMLLLDDPFTGGYKQRGGVYDLSDIESGMGVEKNLNRPDAAK